MKKTIFFSQILNQKMCLLSINSVQAKIQEKSMYRHIHGSRVGGCEGMAF